jgi:hypothetical protein
MRFSRIDRIAKEGYRMEFILLILWNHVDPVKIFSNEK